MLQEFTHCLNAVFPPPATLLVAAAGRLRRYATVGIDIDGARLDFFGKPESAADVARPYPGCKPEVAVVGELNRMLFVFESHDRQHRAKDLLLSDSHRRCDIHEYRGREVPTAARDPDRLAAGHTAGAFTQSERDITLDALKMRLIGNRADLCRGQTRVTESQVGNDRLQAADKVIVQFILDQQARTGHTALPV